MRFRPYKRKPRVRITVIVAAVSFSAVTAALLLAPRGTPAQVPAPTSPNLAVAPGAISSEAIPTAAMPPAATASVPIPAGTSARSTARWPILNGPHSRPNFTLRVPILMYHRVIDPALEGRSAPQLVVPPALFAAQMTTLRRAGWRTIDTATLAADVATGRRPPPRTFVISFDDGYADGYTEAFPILRRLHFVATYFIVTGRLGWSDELTVADVKALDAGGMEIGDHTVDHVDLNSLSDPRLHDEVFDSRLSILRTVSEPPVSFAYPFGVGDAAVASVVESAGFEMAVTNREGVRETWANRFHVPRLRVGPGTGPADLLQQMARYA